MGKTNHPIGTITPWALLGIQKRHIHQESTPLGIAVPFRTTLFEIWDEFILQWRNNPPDRHMNLYTIQRQALNTQKTYIQICTHRSFKAEIKLQSSQVKTAKTSTV